MKSLTYRLVGAARRLGRLFDVICLVLIVVFPAAAASPTFEELLARAKAQAAAGHRWAPSGDNMGETVVTLLDMFPAATPTQITELLALLKNDPQQPFPDTQGLAPPVESAPANRPPAPGPVASTDATELSVPLHSTPTPVAGTGAAAGDFTMHSAPAMPAPAASQPQLSAKLVTRPTARAIELYNQGRAAEQRGDISAARRFYLSAAQMDDAAAALSLGRLYDPAYVDQTAVGGIDADPALARLWYERATALGDPEAGPLLEVLSVR
ncbi:hypothetical protein [Rhodopila sp.]|uniref:hypothetical protein n=1 Tax=Rhodopila sp. TaxID=2480087 RepID=UPI003D0FE17A